jgi:hypothetical protein
MGKIYLDSTKDIQDIFSYFVLFVLLAIKIMIKIEIKKMLVF